MVRKIFTLQRVSLSRMWNHRQQMMGRGTSAHGGPHLETLDRRVGQAVGAPAARMAGARGATESVGGAPVLGFV